MTDQIQDEDVVRVKHALIELSSGDLLESDGTIGLLLEMKQTASVLGLNSSSGIRCTLVRNMTFSTKSFPECRPEILESKNIYQISRRRK